MINEMVVLENLEGVLSEPIAVPRGAYMVKALAIPRFPSWAEGNILPPHKFILFVRTKECCVMGDGPLVIYRQEGLPK